ncbi:MAG: hypothetical protein JSW00_01810 [Thermoplasmata archaeon]|nr:MAG: hypothetical protein JSW00_01810 [Thermoplasmata archaeon]
MREEIVGILVCVLLIGTCAVLPEMRTVSGDPLVEPMYLQSPNPGGWDVNATWPAILADDFPCNKSGLIVGIRFWGSWEEDQIGIITNVHLSLHENIPDPDGPGPLFSKPGDELWSYNALPDYILPQINSTQNWLDPHNDVWNLDDHEFWYEYQVTIPDGDAYYQELGTIYWLDIQVTATGGIWGWKTSNVQWEDDAVWGYWAGGDPNSITWEELRDPETGDSLDMGFGIITKEVPPVTVIGVEINPPTLNILKTGGVRGNWVTVYIEINDTLSVRDINPKTILMEKSIPPELNEKYGFVKSEDGYIKDEDNDGILERMVKFDRSEMEDVFPPGVYNIKITGKFVDGTEFEGESNAFRVK